jgi:hypothetical protein
MKSSNSFAAGTPSRAPAPPQPPKLYNVLLRASSPSRAWTKGRNCLLMPPPRAPERPSAPPSPSPHGIHPPTTRIRPGRSCEVSEPGTQYSANLPISDATNLTAVETVAEIKMQICILISATNKAPHPGPWQQ